MESLPDIDKCTDAQDWWTKSKRLLRKNIEEATSKNTEKEIVDAMRYMLELLENIKIKDQNTN